MLKNMKISARMLLSYMLIVALMVITSIVAIIMLNNVANAIGTFYETSFQVVNEAWEGRWRATQIRANILQATLEDDARATSDYISGAKQHFTGLQEMSAKLEQDYRGDSNGDRSKLRTVQNDITQLAPILEHLYTYAENHETERGYTYLVDVYEPVADDIRDQLSGINDDAQARSLSRVEEADATAGTARIVIIIMCVVSAALGVFLAITISKGIVNPIKEMELGSKKLSEGDLNVTVEYKSSDELGNLANSMGSLVLTVRSIITDIEYQLASMGDGNFNVRSKNPEVYVGQFQRLETAMEKLSATVSETLLQIDNSADQVNSGGEQVSSSAQALAQGATEQASSIQELASTVSDINNKVEATAGHASQAQVDNKTAAETIQLASGHMTELMGAMRDIEEKSQEISKVIKTIEDIAFQTNILALNAAVEAARAGTAGKGFAVVADEVRNLATKSQEASASTATLIEDTVRAVKEGSRISIETEQALNEAIARAEKVTTAVVMISEQTNEQMHAVQQVSTGIDQISSVVQTNSATAEESAAASEELSGQANLLKELIGRFTLRTGGGNSGGSYTTSAPSAPSVGFDARRYSSGDKY